MQFMEKLYQYSVAQALEKDLGDPRNPESIMSFSKVIEIDESEEFPHQQINWLYDWQLQDYYVPSNCGGKFTSFEELVAIIRVLSRRDQTIGIAFTTMFWSFLTWMAGTETQKQKLSQYLRKENGAVCLGYSEKEHGSDLIGGDLTAKKVEGGYILNGEKWPINRATICGVAYILAKTDLEGGAKSLSLFAVDKSEINPENYYNLPKILTHGIRASDMSGIGFKNCFIPESMLLQNEGDGLELALKGFQITRTLCAAFSHGAADTALRTTISFALERKIYNQTVFDLPHARQTLVNGFIDILLCDCQTIASARGFHVIPEQFSVWASVVKYFVTTQLETMINNVSVVLGSRFYLREEHESGIFQKLLRDNSIISMFDGSSVVNLHALILQLRQLTKQRRRRDPKTAEKIKPILKTIFSLEEDLPTFIPQKLTLFGRGLDYPLQGLEFSIEELKKLTDEHVNQKTLSLLIDLSEILVAELDKHDEIIAESKFEYGHHQSPELFEIAKKYCHLHTAACCLHIWIYNRQNLGEFFAKGEWLVLSLHKLLSKWQPMPYCISEEMCENLAQEMIKLVEQDRLFSIVPLQLAQNNRQITIKEDKTNANSKLYVQAN